MNKKWETRQEMGVNGKRDKTRYIIFQRKTRKTEKIKKNKGGKARKKHRKLQEIQKQDFEEILENAEKGNKILARFWKMLKQEQKQGLLKRHDTTIREQN
jgi:hypothetical protein